MINSAYFSANKSPWSLGVLTCSAKTGLVEGRFGYSDYKSDYFATPTEKLPLFIVDCSYFVEARGVARSALIRREHGAILGLVNRLVADFLARNKLIHNHPKVILKVSYRTPEV